MYVKFTKKRFHANHLYRPGEIADLPGYSNIPYDCVEATKQEIERFLEAKEKRHAVQST